MPTKQDIKDVVYVFFWEMKILLFICCFIIPPFIFIALYTPFSEDRFETTILISAYSLNIVLFTFFALKILQAYRDKFLKILIGKFCLGLLIFIPIDIIISNFDGEQDRAFYFEYLLMIIFFILNVGFAYAIDKWIYKSKTQNALKDLTITKSSHAFYGLIFLFFAIMSVFFILYDAVIQIDSGFLILDIRLSYAVLLATVLFIICHHHRYKPYVLIMSGITGLMFGSVIVSDSIINAFAYSILA